MEIFEIAGQHQYVNGKWDRDDTEQEMIKNGFQNHNWIDYLITHQLEEMDQGISDAFAVLVNAGHNVEWSGYISGKCVQLKYHHS